MWLGKLGIALMVLLLATSLAHAECQSLQQVRKEYPHSFLSWRGNHCWFAKDKSRPSHRAKEDTVSIPTSEGSSPSTAATPPPAVDQVLTEDSLIMHGVEHLSLTDRLDDSSKQIDNAVVQWQSIPRPEWISRERALRALGVIVFVSVVLAIIIKIAGRTLYRMQNLT